MADIMSLSRGIPRLPWCVCVVVMSVYSMSWHYWSLRQRRDTTCGLIYALAPLVSIDVDALGTSVPPLHAAQFQAASQVSATPAGRDRPAHVGEDWCDGFGFL